MSQVVQPAGLIRGPSRRRSAGVIVIVLAALLMALAHAGAASAATRTFTGISLVPGGIGYVAMSNAGEAYAFGMPYRGGPRGFGGRIVSVSATANGAGYAAVSSTGQVYAYGNVVYRGNPTGFSGEIAGISVTAGGSGYVVVSTRGQVYAYNVPYRGNAQGFTGRITGVSVTANGSGYDLVSSAGQVYAFNTRYHANPVGFTGEIVSISTTADGSGYYAVSSAGQVYAYGTRYLGNPTGFTGTIVGISAKADGSGYVAMSSSGQVYAYGTPYLGNGDPGSPDPPTDPPPAVNGFPPDVRSAPDTARYDDAPSWSGGANCSGGFTPGARRMQDWLRANWGAATIQGYSCRPNTANTSRTSIHGVGRASDWFRNANNANHRAQVASFIARMSANGAAMARATGVQYWIWNRQQYRVRSSGVERRSYSGPNPHTDHVHLEQNIAGSRLETSYWRLAGG